MSTQTRRSIPFAVMLLFMTLGYLSPVKIPHGPILLALAMITMVGFFVIVLVGMGMLVPTTRRSRMSLLATIAVTALAGSVVSGSIQG